MVVELLTSLLSITSGPAQFAIRLDIANEHSSVYNSSHSSVTLTFNSRFVASSTKSQINGLDHRLN